MISTYYDPMEESLKKRQELMERANRMTRRNADTERGYALLGYVQVMRPQFDTSGSDTSFTWARQREPQLAGLPAALCQRATAAADAYDAATAALEAARQRVNLWIAQHPTADTLTIHSKSSEMTVEESSALVWAQSALDNVALELATAAADLDRIRAELAAIPERIRQRRAECQAAEQADQNMERDLRAQLAKYGFV